MGSRITAACVVVAACNFKPVETTTDAVSGDAPEIVDGAPADADSLLDGLVAWYPMDEVVNSVLADATGNGHDAACPSCPGVAAGKRGMALEFNGTNHRFEAPDAPGLRTASAYSVAFWIQFDTLPGGNAYSCAVTKGQNEGIFNTWQLCYEAMTQTWMFGTQGPGPYDFMRVGSPGPMLDEWHHVVLWWDGATKQLWIDGQMRAAIGQSSVVFDDRPLTIGSDIDNGTAAHFLDGFLDDVRVYDRALTLDEITRLAAP